MTELPASSFGIDLYWLPLGAGGNFVRLNGRIYEAAMARIQRRTAQPLFHSALMVHLPPDSYAIEMTPVWGVPKADRGVVAEGTVGAAAAGRSRLFRYEVRRWRGGEIGDVAEAIDSPQRLSSHENVCRSLFAALPDVPTPVWGRDELHTGDMWNSNSVTSWALTMAGIDARALHPPTGGRAPGWDAGIQVADFRAIP